MKKAIITGPTGAIGMALIKKCIEENVSVVAVCRPGSLRKCKIEALIRNYQLSNEQLRIFEKDISDICSLAGCIEKEEGATVFYHLGWEGTFGNARNDMYAQMKNIEYTLNAVDVASEIGCTVFVGAGSQAEYGRTGEKLSPCTNTNPENGYGIAKLCAGQLSRLHCQQKGLRHIWTRILSVYGPHDGDNTLIMSTIVKLVNKESTAFTKGEQMWDYLYADDAAEALFMLGNKGCSDESVDGKVYTLGSGEARPLREYIEIIRDIIDENAVLGIGEVPYSPNQVMNLQADISCLIDDIGWRPKTSFYDGINQILRKQDINIRTS